MKLYNSLRNRVEVFEPQEKEVSLYVCGITPYDTTHVGHAFTYTAFDILVRYLEMRGLQVKYVQNVTDIDDDIVRKAREVGEDWKKLGDRWTNYYIRDMQDLNVLPPDEFPRATDAIDEIQKWIQKLFDAGKAYVAGGSVYYSIDSWPTFGGLCTVSLEEMLPLANARGNNPNDPHKRHPLDFVLWQAQPIIGPGGGDPYEPAWPSPWGPGRPGWHIECSTLATKYLGKVIDIHGGGADLCFPHHECEIAQVEPVTGKIPFVRYWMHVSMVRFEGEKMSKSLGNLVMVRRLLESYGADEIRLYLASHHYRDNWSYDEDDLKKAVKRAARLRRAFAVTGGEQKPALNPNASWAAFTKDMDNDLDTPGALNVVESLADEILEAAEVGRDVQEAQQTLHTFASVLGMRLDDHEPQKRVVEGWNKYLRSR